nr:hypothetical protein [Cronobacter turicensis]
MPHAALAEIIRIFCISGAGRFSFLRVSRRTCRSPFSPIACGQGRQEVARREQITLISTGGIRDARSWNGQYKTLLLRRAAQSLLLVDRSKRNRTGEVQIGTLEQVAEVITQEENGGQKVGALLVG